MMVLGTSSTVSRRVRGRLTYIRARPGNHIKTDFLGRIEEGRIVKDPLGRKVARLALELRPVDIYGHGVETKSLDFLQHICP